MRARTKHVVYSMGGALALSLAMTVPTFADTTGDTPDNTQTEAVWTDKVAADVNTYANIRVDASINSQRVGRLPKGGVAVAVGEKYLWHGRHICMGRSNRSPSSGGGGTPGGAGKPGTGK